MNSSVKQVDINFPGNLVDPGSLYEREDVFNRSEYWDAYYSNTQKSPPSQFAAFVAGEFSNHSLIIDVGCGNGRDTVFFALLGFNTIGIDGSKAAIDYCKTLVSGFDSSPKKNIFLQKDITDLSKSKEMFSIGKSDKKVIYSRFFLHAINALEEQEFMGYAFSIMNPGDALSLEFRTSQDEYKEKVTSQHYRRYINVSNFIRETTEKYQAKISYQAEGTGFAKYKNDDAHVCRIIFTKD